MLWQPWPPAAELESYERSSAARGQCSGLCRVCGCHLQTGRLGREGACVSDLPAGPSLIKAIDFARRPLQFLADCAERYGDWFTLRVPGIAPFVFTSDPTAIREIFTGDGADLRAGEANAPLGAFMGPHSLILLDGAAHLHERRLMLPPFHGERMKAYADVMRAITVDAVGEWPLGTPFALHPWMQRITFEVILRTVFGFDAGPRRDQLRQLLQRLFGVFASPLGSALGLPALQVDLGAWSPWGRVLRLRREIDALLYSEFALRRAAGVDGREDVLSMLLTARDENGAPMSDASLRDQMLTLLLAGHETTAAALSWVVHRLFERADVRSALRAELDRVVGDVPVEPRHIDELKYLDAVIKETSRLDPVIPNVGRKLRVPMRIAGRALPAGVVVAPCIYLAHRRSDLWEDPTRFDPERFLSGRAPSHAFFPFGGGTRRCIGATFATYEMKIVLAEVLSTMELSPVPGYRVKVVRRSIAFSPSQGLPVIAARRHAAATAN
jgi:cytochrome P450 family 110